MSNENPPKEEPATNAIVQKLTPLLKPERKTEGVKIIETMVAKFHQGPLPTPEDFAHYDVTCPGAADRILSMAERQSSHRQSMERGFVRKQFALEILGIVGAIIALMLMLSLAAFCVYLKQPIPASILGAGTIVAIVKMFLVREAQPKPEAIKKPAATAKKRKAPTAR